uniref:Uncharacterized protein n=1 Tax=Siphoviridae sp. ct3fB6 TaxID=2827770 RepID=A0A8S5T917_9CAUD|nr:MAG TPA: hypothetical protein [Siphoviridae sp. ct3fB6]DAM25930.1 MAG TPA: hypothetical protein [Caudoviricetes sp.]
MIDFAFDSFFIEYTKPEKLYLLLFLLFLR